MHNNPTYQNNSPQHQSPQLRVTLVTRTADGSAAAAVATDVANFCKDKNVVFMMRQYDAQEYSEDQEEIQRLPAFHIYEIRSNAYLSTFYPTEDPTRHIQKQLDDFKEREAVARSRRQAWDRRIAFLISLFRLPTVPLLPFRKSRSLSSLQTATD